MTVSQRDVCWAKPESHVVDVCRLDNVVEVIEGRVEDVNLPEKVLQFGTWKAFHLPSWSSMLSSQTSHGNACGSEGLCIGLVLVLKGNSIVSGRSQFVMV
eukprot:2069621-Amphidinium_carterae.1